MKSLIARRLHRWIGLLFSVFALIASGSGLIHNIMTRTQAPPPPARPAGTALDPAAVTVPLSAAIARLADPDRNAPLLAANLRVIGNASWWQLFVTGAPRPHYVNAANGQADDGADERFAAEIASGFLGGKAVRKTDYLTAFNNEYINIFRLLPVYRFDAAGGDPLHTRVYVSTITGSVTRHTDDQRQWEANVFTNFHKFGFIPNKDLRDLTLSLTTSGIFLAALSGVALFFMTRPQRRLPSA
jgi:uncharacterized iron-regulated membrane protein